jgi:hypothetical protein
LVNKINKTKQNEKILITGGAGFVVPLSKRLLNEGKQFA